MSQRCVAELEPKIGHTDRFKVKMEYGESIEPQSGTDTAAMYNGHVSLTWLTRLEALAMSTPRVDAAVEALLGRG